MGTIEDGSMLRTLSRRMSREVSKVGSTSSPLQSANIISAASVGGPPLTTAPALSTLSSMQSSFDKAMSSTSNFDYAKFLVKLGSVDLTQNANDLYRSVRMIEEHLFFSYQRRVMLDNPQFQSFSTMQSSTGNLAMTKRTVDDDVFLEIQLELQLLLHVFRCAYGVMSSDIICALRSLQSGICAYRALRWRLIQQTADKVAHEPSRLDPMEAGSYKDHGKKTQMDTAGKPSSHPKLSQHTEAALSTKNSQRLTDYRRLVLVAFELVSFRYASCLSNNTSFQIQRFCGPRACEVCSDSLKASSLLTSRLDTERLSVRKLKSEKSVDGKSEAVGDMYDESRLNELYGSPPDIGPEFKDSDGTGGDSQEQGEASHAGDESLAPASSLFSSPSISAWDLEADEEKPNAKFSEFYSACARLRTCLGEGTIIAALQIPEKDEEQWRSRRFCRCGFCFRKFSYRSDDGTSGLNTNDSSPAGPRDADARGHFCCYDSSSLSGLASWSAVWVYPSSDALDLRDTHWPNIVSMLSRLVWTRNNNVIKQTPNSVRPGGNQGLRPVNNSSAAFNAKVDSDVRGSTGAGQHIDMKTNHLAESEHPSNKVEVPSEVDIHLNTIYYFAILSPHFALVVLRPLTAAPATSFRTASCQGRSVISESSASPIGNIRFPKTRAELEEPVPLTAEALAAVDKAHNDAVPDPRAASRVFGAKQRWLIKSVTYPDHPASSLARAPSTISQLQREYPAILDFVKRAHMNFSSEGVLERLCETAREQSRLVELWRSEDTRDEASPNAARQRHAKMQLGNTAPRNPVEALWQAIVRAFGVLGREAPQTSR